MTTEIEKSKWLRWILDGLLVVSIALLSWAGTVLWSMSNSQVVIASKTESMSKTLVTIQQNQSLLIKEIDGLKLWKAETSGNRFTAQDGHDVWQEIAKIRERMAALPTETPPSWFIDEVRGLSTRVTTLEKEMRHTVQQNVIK